MNSEKINDALRTIELANTIEKLPNGIDTYKDE